MAKGKSSGGSFRSAISGRFVTAKHGKASPRTTVSETRGGGSTGSARSAISMFEKTIQELRRIERTKSLSIPIESDAEGYLDKECPVPRVHVSVQNP